MFEETKKRAQAAIPQLCQLAAYRVVFFDLRGPLLEGLYSGSVGRARLGGVLGRLGDSLVVIVDNIHAKLRDAVVLALLKALLEGYLRVLLAPGPNRAYQIQDATLLEDDLAEMKDLFVDGGEGLAMADVEMATTRAEDILGLFSAPTDALIAQFEAAYRQALTEQGEKAAGGIPHGKAALAKLPVPPGGWSPGDANTLLRVLCYRGDRKASKYLKKLFDVPKEAWKH